MSFSFLISYPIRITQKDDEQNLSSCFNETLSSETTNTIFLTPPVTSYHACPANRTSYFNSTIEAAMKQRLNDDEPIPFIDETISTSHSRKSSVYWSDKTSWSSRFSLAWKLNRMRLASRNRSTSSNERDKRRYRHRNIQYTIPPPSSQGNHLSDEL